MSMPSFPQNGADMTWEQALTMIIASIAMEELALSHILNAEGEKLQYVLGTLPGGRPCADTQDVLAVNQSVAALLDVVLQNQMLLKSKLEKVLEAAGDCCQSPCEQPCSPSCPGNCPCAKSVIRLTGQRDGFLWNKGCFMSWKCCGVQGEHIQWNANAPAWVRLNPEKAYSVHLWLNVRGLRPGGESGTIFIRQTPLNGFMETPPFYFSFSCCEGVPQTLEYTALLFPQECPASWAEISVLLSSQCALSVERATLDIVEL